MMNFQSFSESSGFLKSILEATPSGISVTDERGNFVFVNKAFCNIYGYSLEELTGKNFLTLVAKSHHEQAQKSHEAFIQSGKEEFYEWSEITKAGCLIDISVHWKLLVLPEGQKLKVATVQGFKNHKDKRIQNHAEERKIEELINTSNDLIWSLDKDYKLLVANNAFLEKLKSLHVDLNPGDCILKAKNTNPIELHYWKNLYDKALQGKTVSCERREVGSGDENESWIEIKINPISENGLISGIACFCRNITERKINHHKILDLNEKLEVAQEIGKIGYWDLDLESGELYWSDQVYKIWGVDQSHFTPNFENFQKSIHPDDREDFDNYHIKVLKGEIPHDIIHRIILPNNEIKWVHEKGELLKDRHTDRIKFKGTVQDVTDQKKIELALLERNSFIETTLNNLPIGISVRKTDSGESTFINKQLLEIYGWPQDELTDENTFFEKVFPDPIYRKEIRSRIVSDLQSGDPAKRNWSGINVTTKNGKIKIINANNFLLPEQGLMISTVIDDTERHMAALEAEKNYERFLYATQAVSDAIWDWDIQEGTIFWGDGYKKLFGYPMETNFVSEKEWDTKIHPEDYPEIWKSILKARQNPKAFKWTGEYRFQKYDGTYTHVKENTVILRDESGQPVRMIGALQDISERIKAAEIVSEERNMLRTLIDNVPDFIYVKDKNSREIINNKASLEILGAASEEETIGKTAFDYFESEIAQRIIADDKTVIESGKSLYNREEFIAEKNGVKKWLLTTKVPLIDKDGQITGLIGISRDITEIKKREQHLKLLESVITNANDSVLITEGYPLDSPGPKIVYVNTAFTRMTGYNAHEVLGKSPRILQGPKTDRKELDRLKQAMIQGKSCEIETINYKKNGEEFWINFTINPVVDQQGKISHFISIERDITQKKRDEQALLNKTKFLEGISDTVKSLLENENWESVLNPALAVIANVLEVERSYYFQSFLDPDSRKLCVKQLKEWNVWQGNLAENDLSQNVYPLENYPKIFHSLNHKNHFSLNHRQVEGPIQAIFIEKNIQSLLFMPIYILDEFYGYLGVDDCKEERIWSEEEISFLKTIASSLAISIERKRNIDLIKESYNEKNTILESIGDAFFAVDKNWIVTYWNKVAEKILQNKKEDILGKNLWDVYQDAIGTDFYRQYHLAVRINQPVHFEEYYPTLALWFEVSAYPSSNGLSVYFKNITDRKLAADQIRLSNERFEKVAEATNEAIWDWDIENDSVYRSSGYHTLFGYGSDELGTAQNNWIKHIHPDDLEYVKESFFNSLRKPGTNQWKCEYRFLKKDGGIAYVIDSGAIIRNKAGKPIRMVGSMQDITYRKEHEESLKQLNEHLEKSNRKLTVSNQELEQFAYVASHDMQEPLRMITNFLTKIEMKYADILDEKGKKYIHFAVDGAKRMQQIILDLLDFSRLNENSDHIEEISILEIVEEAQFLLIDKIEISGAIVCYDSLPVIQAPKAPIRQLFQGLLTNALKYHKLDIKPEISISAKESPFEWEFAIKDNGIGISEEYFEKIFVIFQRLHQKEEYTGSGMGLAICKKIVENMGGKIWVQSQKEIGSTFYFTIPKQHVFIN